MLGHPRQRRRAARRVSGPSCALRFCVFNLRKSIVRGADAGKSDRSTGVSDAAHGLSEAFRRAEVEDAAAAMRVSDSEAESKDGYGRRGRGSAGPWVGGRRKAGMGLIGGLRGTECVDCSVSVSAEQDGETRRRGVDPTRCRRESTLAPFDEDEKDQKAEYDPCSHSSSLLDGESKCRRRRVLGYGLGTLHSGAEARRRHEASSGAREASGSVCTISIVEARLRRLRRSWWSRTHLSSSTVCSAHDAHYERADLLAHDTTWRRGEGFRLSDRTSMLTRGTAGLFMFYCRGKSEVHDMDIVQ